MAYTNSLGKGRVSVTQWENKDKIDETKTFVTYSVQKSYKDDAGNWVNTSTFTEKELCDLVTVIQATLAGTVVKRGETEVKK